MRAHRFSRGKTNQISFFSFQDIITGTAGFLIVLSIFLALSLEKTIAISSDTDPSGLKVKELENVLTDVLSLRQQFAKIRLLPLDEAKTLERSIADLKESIADISARLQVAENKSVREESLFERERRIQKQKLISALEELKKKQREAQKTAELATSKMADLESEVKDVEAMLQKARDRKNVLRLVPERSDTTKEPVLVLVKSAPWIIQRFDGSARLTAHSIVELMEHLRSMPPASHYVVFYFKSSAARDFDGVVNRVRSAGYEIGYDVIPENIELEFSPNADGGE